MKKITGIYGAPRSHWVGDGFPVQSLFSYHSHGQHLSPFLLLDYAQPTHFEPAAKPRGVGVHPHRGYEAVTIVYQGELEHRDSTGAGGKIGPGDVQWMTAAAGILHEEFHSQAFARTGGMVEMVQLWVNLPARAKLTAPKYQTLTRAQIPVVELPDGAGTLRVIAGDYAGQKGAAETFTPLDVWDVRLQQDKTLRLTVPESRSLAIVVLHGTVQVNGAQVARATEWVLLGRAGQQVEIEANNDAMLLLLSGEPIDEPIVGRGPFVMNTEAEIRQAIHDFNTGQFGSMS